MQISYLLYDGSAYPKLTPPVSSPYQTTLSLSLSLSISFLPSLTAFHSLPLSLSLLFSSSSIFPSLFSHRTRSSLPRRASPSPFHALQSSLPLLSSPLRLHFDYTYIRTRRVSSIYSLLDSRARSSAFAFLAHAFPTSSRSCTHGVSHLWRMLLSLFMTRTVLILGLASKGLFKGRRTGVGCLSLSLSLLCDALSRNRLKTGGSNLHHPGGGWLLLWWWYSSTPLLPLRKDNCE